MKRTVRVLWLLVAGVVAPMGAAHASSFTNYCYAGGLNTCFSATVTTSPGLNGGTHVQIMIRNLSLAPSGTQASWITAVALTSPANIGSASGLGVSVTPTVGMVGVTDPNQFWRVLTHSTGGGSLGNQLMVDLGSGQKTINKITTHQVKTDSTSSQQCSTRGKKTTCTTVWHFTYTTVADTTWQYSSPKDGAIIGCGSNVGGATMYFRTCNPTYSGWVVFDFETSGSWSGDQAALMVKFQTAQGSFECFTDPTQAGSQQPCTSTVTPEPVTMVLLGSGLAGMGGIGVIRRRKRDGDIESD